MRTPMQKNLEPIPRTVSEAVRDARYACAIQTFKSDTKLALDFLGNAIIGFTLVGIGLSLPVLLYFWVTKG